MNDDTAVQPQQQSAEAHAIGELRADLNLPKWTPPALVVREVRKQLRRWSDTLGDDDTSPLPAGTRIRVNPDHVSDPVAHAVAGRTGTVLEQEYDEDGDQLFWDVIAHFAGTTRENGLFGFHRHQVRPLDTVGGDTR